MRKRPNDFNNTFKNRNEFQERLEDSMKEYGVNVSFAIPGLNSRLNKLVSRFFEKTTREMIYNASRLELVFGCHGIRNQVCLYFILW